MYVPIDSPTHFPGLLRSQASLSNPSPNAFVLSREAVYFNDGLGCNPIAREADTLTTKPPRRVERSLLRYRV